MRPRLHIAGSAADAGADEPGTRQLCTLVLTDLVDSTALIEARGDAGAADVFHRVDRIVRDLLTQHDGLEIDRTDGHLVMFDLPLSGVQYAVTLHERLAELARELGVPLACRAAIHVGEVIVRSNAPDDVAHGAKPVEVEGIAKPSTARLLSLALPRQTLLGRTAYELARRATVGQPGFDHYVWASYGEYHFQGLEEPFDVHEVGLAGHAPLQAPPDSQKAHRSVAPASAPATRWRLVAVLVPLALLVSAAVYVTRGPSAPSTATPVVRFLVNPPGTRLSAEACLRSPLAISHDGKTVAFAAANDAGRELGLVIRPLDRLGVQPAHLDSPLLGPAGSAQLPSTGPDTSTSTERWLWSSRDPFFSPDDRWLGFFQGNQLARVLLNGGSPERVDSPVVESELGAMSGGSQKGGVWTSAGIIAAPGIWSGLVSYPLGGGPAVALTSPDTDRGETSHRWPDLLPDGAHLLVSIKTRSLTSFDDGNIAVVPIEGGTPEVMWSGGYYPRYSPSGHIVFARQGSLMAVPFDAKRNVITGPAVTVLRDVAMSPDNGTAAFAISRNGTLVYAPGPPCRYETQLVWASSEGTEEPIDLPAGYYYSPVLSPDATRIAVLLHGAYDTLYLQNLQRKTLARVTSGVNVESFVWDRDGEHLFVMFLDRDGGAIARVRADGTGEPEVFYRRPSDVPIRLNALQSFAGHDALLATVDGPEGRDIVLVSVGANAEVTPVVATSDSESDPAVSPDGRCLAYASLENGKTEVYVRPFPTGAGRTQVSNAGGSQPLWSKDGTWLLYTPAVADADPRHRRTAVPIRPGNCSDIGTPTPMAAPPGERVLEIREGEKKSAQMDVVAIQGWADTLVAASTAAR